MEKMENQKYFLMLTLVLMSLFFVSFASATPTIDAITESTAGNLLNAQDFTLTVNWTDVNASRVYMCKTDAITNTSVLQECTGDAWATNTTENSNNQSIVSYTILTSDAGGQKDYYVFVVNAENVSSASTSGTFTVSKPIEDEDDSGAIISDDTEADGEGMSGGMIAIIVIVLLAVAFVMFGKKK